MDNTQDVDGRGLTAAQRRSVASIAGLTGWVNTPDRRTRMQTPQAASPKDVRWHAAKLGYDPDALTDEQRAQAETARRLYFSRLAYASASARRRKKRGTA